MSLFVGRPGLIYRLLSVMFLTLSGIKLTSFTIITDLLGQTRERVTMAFTYTELRKINFKISHKRNSIK